MGERFYPRDCLRFSKMTHFISYKKVDDLPCNLFLIVRTWTTKNYTTRKTRITYRLNSVCKQVCKY